MITDTPLSVGLLWVRDQPDAETSTRQHTTRTRLPMPPAGFEPAISASETRDLSGPRRLRSRGHCGRRLLS